MAGRQIEVAPRHALRLRRGRIPRMVRIGEAHPAEPVVVGGRASRARRWCDRPPSRCGTTRAGSGCTPPRVRPSRRRRAAESSGAKPLMCSGWLALDANSRSSASRPSGDVHRQLHVLEAAVRSGRALARHAVLEPAPAQVDSRARSAPCRAARCGSRPVARYAATLGASAGSAHAVGEDAVRAHVLSGEHRRARRHAHHVLVVGASVVDARARRAGRPPACARPCRRCSRARRSAAGRW